MTRGRRVVGLGAGLMMILVAGCGLLTSLDGLSGGEEPSEGGAGASDGASPDQRDPDRPDGGAGVDAEASCPALRGPAMVRVGKGDASFCIDATEVTNDDYQLFLADFGLTPKDAGAVCAWNGTLRPHQAWPAASGDEKLPRTYIDWCDARAYCEWAGKRLCGRLGGGAAGPAEIADPLQSEWVSACSRGGERVYPYGDTYDPTACYGRTLADGGEPVVAVASLPKCEGGYDGLFDMSGNVREWLDGCESRDGGPRLDDCFASSSVYDDELNLACRKIPTVPRNYVAFDIGIRCCQR